MADAMPSRRNVPVIDLLGGTIATLNPPRGKSTAYGQKLMDAGIDAIAVTMGLYARDIRPILREFFDWQCLFEQMPDRVLHVRTAADLTHAAATGRIGVILGVQGLHFIDEDTVFIPILAKLGLRVAALVYNEQTQFGAGCMERTDAGLTLLGQRAIEEMNRSSILVDVTHAGHRTSMDIIEISTKPVVATHSNAYRLTPSPRNLKDDQIKAIAESGGVIGVSPYSPFCAQPDKPRPDVEAFLDHVCVIAEMVGARHVGIGTDFFPHTKVKWENSTGRMYRGMTGRFKFEDLYAEGLEEHEQFPAVPAGLARRGFSPADIENILGGNAMRVFDAVWTEA